MLLACAHTGHTRATENDTSAENDARLLCAAKTKLSQNAAGSVCGASGSGNPLLCAGAPRCRLTLLQSYAPASGNGTPAICGCMPLCPHSSRSKATRQLVTASGYDGRDFRMNHEFKSGR